MTAARWTTRLLGVGLVAVLAAVLGNVTALPSGAAQGSRAASVAGTSAGGVPSVDGHLALRSPAPMVVKRFAGAEQAVVPTMLVLGINSPSPALVASIPALPRFVAPGSVTARAPPAEGTSRS